MATNAAALPNPQLARIGAGVRPFLVLMGIAAAVAAGVTVALWSQGPNWGLLYASLAADDAANVVQALQAAGIEYKVDSATGAVMVPQERINDARLKLAGQGLPAGDGGGFELIRKDPGFGVSQFMETARYQHALEIELARTIMSLQAVEGARVHLATPAQSAFVRDRKPGSASVFVKLRPGRQLEANQVSGIVHLVASSIPGLEADGVTIVDQQGRLLSAPKSPEAQAADEQLEASRRIEATYIGRIEELLTPLVGQGRVRAQVTAELDSSATEEAREIYNPQGQVVRSEQLSEQMTQSGNGAGGVPGALTNQPPPAGVALPPNTPANANANPGGAASPQDPAAAATVATTPENASKQQTRNYEIDRTLSYSKQPAGQIRRLTVAVLVDNPRTLDKDGKPVEQPLEPKQLEDITRLVRDAVGFNEQRGDSVNVVNASFIDDGSEVGEIEPAPLWEHPLARDAARLLLGAIVAIVLLLVVVRPLMRSLMSPARAAAPNLPAGAIADPSGQLEAPAASNAPALGAPKQQKTPQMEYEEQVAAARTLVSQDPKRVAQVVKNWVGTDE
ncbi:MAG TPA: flagellar basal-body MS-ring/collar protein FliF [Steroidobacteraceae bacterium]|nr:flagellar basal-body MS-ring/collar protein FliF [Steroidobacteraceae bacterium]